MNVEEGTWRKASRIGMNWFVRLYLPGFCLILVLSSGQDIQSGPGSIPWLIVAMVVGALLGFVGFGIGFLLGLFLLSIQDSPDEERVTTRFSPVLAGFIAWVSAMAYIGWMGILSPGYAFREHPSMWHMEAITGSCSLALLVFFWFRSR